MITHSIETADLSALGSRWCITSDGLKIPRDADGVPLSVNQPETWMSFHEAVDASSRYSDSTLGLLLDPEDDLVCIDIDDCLDQSGHIKSKKIESLVQRADTYTEISMSGRGLHLFVHASDYPKLPSKGYPEIYDGSSPSYIAITGRIFQGHDRVRCSDEVVVRAVAMNSEATAKALPNPRAKTMTRSITVEDEASAVITALELLSEHRRNDRNEWFRVMRAVQYALGEDGWDVLNQWSAYSPSYDQHVNRSQWDSPDDDSQPITLGTLLFMAKEDSGLQIKIANQIEESDEGNDLMFMTMESLYRIDEIPEELEAEWIVEGLIAVGHHTLLSGREKSGKSTLLGGLLKCLVSPEGGTFLGITITGGRKVLVISEESKIQISLQTLGGIAFAIATIVGMWFALQADIAEAKELPAPAAPEITRMEFDMKDQLVRQTIMTTQEDVSELKEDLDRIEAKIDKLK